VRQVGISAVALALSTSVLAADTTRLEEAALAAAESRARTAVVSLAVGPAIFDTTQAFTITVAAAKRQVLPVRYAPRAPAPVANVDHCALVILSPDRVQVVQTVGTGYTETLGCTGLEAIGFADLDGDGRLDIALIQATLAPPDRYLKTPVVVRGYGDGNFAVDETLTAALNERGGITTIGALQRAVSQLRAEATQRQGRDRAKPPSTR
jgi:hypothetical protein